MKTLAPHIMFAMICIILFSCNSQRPVNYRTTYSYGFHHKDHIYFVLDYDVWQRGRRFWFIMPVELPRKVHFREIYLYRYEPDLRELEQLGVLRKEFVPATDVRYSKFTKDNDKIIFLYYAGYDESIKRQIDIFIWDSRAEEFVDTGYENPVDKNNPLYKKYFSDYIFPRRDNPGIIAISRLRNEILQHLTIEDYGLPREW